MNLKWGKVKKAHAPRKLSQFKAGKRVKSLFLTENKTVKDKDLTPYIPGQYTTSEINDIKFYTLYAVCAQLVSSVYPSNKAISSLNNEQVDDTLINNAINLVYDLYKDLGGNDKIAKGPNLSESLKNKLRLTGNS